MASVTPLRNPVRFHEENYPVWQESFPDQVRREMIQDDLAAGTSVSMVLLSVITIGLILGIVSVLCTL